MMTQKMRTTRKSKKRIKLNTLDKILIGCASFLVSFTITMVVVFIVFQDVPDTLITSVFGVLGGEISLTFVIWYIKKRYARKYEKEDRDNGQVEE